MTEAFAVTEAIEKCQGYVGLAQATLIAIEQWCQRSQAHPDAVTDPAALLAAWHHLGAIARELLLDFQPAFNDLLDSEVVGIAAVTAEFLQNLFGMTEVVNLFMKDVGLWGCPQLSLSLFPETLGVRPELVEFWSVDDRAHEPFRLLGAASISHSAERKREFLSKKSQVVAGYIGHSVRAMIDALDAMETVMKNPGSGEQVHALPPQRWGVHSQPASPRTVGGGNRNSR